MMKEKIRQIFICAAWSLLDGFIVASALTLSFASDHESNIYYIQSAPEINSLMLVCVTMIVWAVLFFIFSYRKNLIKPITPLCMLFFSVCILSRANTVRPYITLILCGITVALIFIMKGKFPDKLKLTEGKRVYLIVGIAAVIVTAQVAAGTIARHFAYSSSTFDLGIFSQMFESMATDLSQNTTLERAYPLSHFAVHFSPIFYILLPFYMIFRNVEFLLTAQAVICFSGVIPLLLLCKKWRYGETLTLFISMAFLLYPAFTCACFYDFHENAFLTPLILWLLYFVEKNSTWAMMLCGVLLLCVKEDAGIYVVFCGLYALAAKNKSKTDGFILIGLGIAGFIISASAIELYGEGIKVSRYSVYLNPGETSLANVVINVLKNPVFFLSHVFSEEKILFFLQMLAPLLFIPLFSRKLCDWMLIVPFILVNAASDYVYQADINYQYVFGTGALLIFLFAKNIRYCKGKGKVAVAAAMATAVCLVGFSAPKFRFMSDLFYNENAAATSEALDEIPRDAVIYASTYLTPHLYNCPNVYMYPSIYKLDEDIRPDYICLDTRTGLLLEYDMLVDSWEKQGYTVFKDAGYVTILQKPAE